MSNFYSLSDCSFSKKILLFSGFIISFFFLFFVFSGAAHAATIDWTGSAGDNWSNSNNWDGSVPGASDDVVVSGTTGNIDIDQDVTVKSLTVTSSRAGNAYNGVIEPTTTISNINVSTTGKFIVNSGQSSAGVSSTNHSTADWFSGGNFKVLSGTVSTSPATTTVSGDFIIRSNGRYVHNSGTTTFDGSGQLVVSTTDPLNNVRFNNSGGGWGLKEELNVSGTLRIDAGFLDLNQKNLDFQSTGSFINNDIFKLKGTETLSNFTNDADSGTTTYNGSGATLPINNYNNLRFNGSGIYTLGGDTSISGTIKIESNPGNGLDTNGNNITVSSTWNNKGGTLKETSGFVRFDGNSGGFIKESGDFSDLFVSSTSGNGSWNVKQESGVNHGLSATGSFKIEAGTLDMNGNTSTFASGSTADTSKIKGGEFKSGSATSTFKDGLTQSGGTFTGGSGDVDVHGAFTLNSGSNFTAPSGKLKARNIVDIKNADSFDANKGELVFYQTNSQQLSDGSYPLASTTIDKSSGTVTPQDSALSVSGTLRIKSGKLDAAKNDTNITVSSSWKNTTNNKDAFKEGNQNVTFDGTGTGPFTINEPGAFSSTTVTGTATWQVANKNYGLHVTDTLKVDGGTVDLNTNNATSTVENNFTLKSGTFDHGGATSTFKGDFTQNGGTFSGSNGDLDINGNVSFNNSNQGTFTAPGGKYLLGGNLNLTKVGTYDISNAPTTTFDGSGNQNLTASGNQLSSIDLSSGNTLQLQDNLPVSGTLKISNGTLDTNTKNADITVSSSWNNSGTFQEGNNKVTLDGNSGGIINEPGSFSALSVSSTDSSGSWNVNTNDLSVTGTFKIERGTLDINGNKATFNGSADIKGSNATYKANTGLNTFDNGLTLSAGSFDGGSSGVVDVNTTTLTISGGTFDAPQGDRLKVSNDLTISGGTFNPNSATTSFDNPSANTQKLTTNGEQFTDIVVSSTGPTVNLQDALSASGTVKIGSGGTLDSNGNNMTVSSSWKNSGTFNTGGSDTVTFDGTSGGPYTINEPGAFNNLTVTGTQEWQPTTNRLKATSTFIVGSNATYNAGANNLKTLASSTVRIKGTYQAGTSNQIFQGDFDNDGTFTPNGGTALFNGGTTQDVDIGSDNFSNFTVDGNGTTVNVTTNTLDVNKSLTVKNNGTLDATTDGGHTIEAAGGWDTSNGTFKEGSQKVKFDGSGGTHDIKESGSFYTLEFNGGGNTTWSAAGSGFDVDNTLDIKTGETFDAVDQNIGVTSTVTIDAGTYKAGSSKQTFAGGLTMTGGTLTGESGDIDIDGTVDLTSGGTFTGPQSSAVVTVSGTWKDSSNNFDEDTNNPEVQFDATSGGPYDIQNGNNSAFYDLTISGTGETFNITNDTLDVDNDFTLSAGTLDVNSQNMTVSGTWNNTNGAANFKEGSNNEKVTFDGTANQKIQNGETFNELVINNSGGKTVSSTAALTVASSTVSGGTFRPYDDTDFNGDVTIDSGATLEAISTTTLTVSGTWKNSGTFNSNSGTTTFDGAGQKNITTNGDRFNNIKFSNGTSTLQDTFKSGGNLTIASGGELDSGSKNITVSSSWKNSSGDFVENSNKVTFDGTGGTHNIDENGAFNDFTFTDSGGTWNLASSLDVNGDVTLNNGTLDSNSNNITVAGSWDTFGASFNENSDKVTFDGGSGTHTIKPADSTDFHNMEVSGGATYELSSYALNVGNQLKVTSGKLGKQGYDKNIDIKGKLIASGGSVTSTKQELKVDGNVDLDGTTFYHNSGTTTLEGSGDQKVTSSGQTFNKLVLDKSTTATPQDKADIDGDLEVKSGTTLDLTEDNDINAKQDVTINGNVSKGTGTWTFDGSGTNSLDANGSSENLGEIKVDGSSKVIDLTNTEAHVTTATIESDDTLDLSGQKLTVDNDVVNKGTFRLKGDETVSITGSIDRNQGTIAYDGGSSYTGLKMGDNYNNLTFNGTGDWTLDNKLDVNDKLTLTQGTLDVDSSNNYQVNVSGTLDLSDKFKERQGTVKLDGSTDQDIKGSDLNFHKLNVHKTTSTDSVSIKNQFAASSTVTVTTGTLKGNNNTTTVEKDMIMKKDGTYSGSTKLTDLKSDLVYKGGEVKGTTTSTLNIAGKAVVDAPMGSPADLTTSSIVTSVGGGNITSTNKAQFNYKTDVKPKDDTFTIKKGTEFSTGGGNDVNFKKLMTDSNISSTPSNITTYGGAQFGLNTTTLDASKKVDVNIPASSNGTFQVYHKEAGGSWKYLNTICDVNNNPCKFTTKSFSQFAPVTLASSGSSSGSSSGGGGGGGGGGSSSSDVTKTQTGEQEGAIVINEGNEVTTERRVTIEFNVKNAEKVALSEDSQFKGVSFDDFPSNKQTSFTLSEGVEEKTVYAKFRDSQGSTITESDSITYNPQGEVIDKEPKEEPKETEEKKEKPLPQELKSDRAYTYPGTSAVYYITQQGTKRPFKNPDVFFTYFDSWGDVQTVSQNALMSVPDDELGFMPWGPKKDFRSGSMIKTVTDPKVYLIIDNKRYWIENGQIFKELGYKWNMITDVDPRVMDKFELGESIDYTDHHPPYSLVKYPDSNKVYRLEPNEKGELVKRHIKDQESFNALGYRLDRIITIDKSEQYPTGEPISVESGEKVPYTFSRYLKRGSQGTEVRNLQKALKNLGYFESEVTGYYGLNTVNAVMDFQEANGMERVGVLGPKTREILNNM